MNLAPAIVEARRIRRAEPGEAAALSDLALTAKAVWSYDAAFIAACRAELSVRPESIRRDPTYLIESEGRVLGFYQLRIYGAVGDVRLMFVAPQALGAGLGRRLWAHLEDTAQTAGVRRLEVDSDPHAEGFYRAMGMRRVGEAPSGSIPGRMLPHLAKELAPRGQEMRRDMSSGGSRARRWRSDHPVRPKPIRQQEEPPMLRQYSPQTVAPPFSRYSHGVETPDNARWLHVSGQVGVAPDGKVLDGAEAQIAQAWRNVLSVLEAAGMGPRDLVKVTTFLVNRADLPTARAVRDRMLQGAEPASTLIFVAGLASPDWQVEIEAIAAAA